jgi:hypothetical protein
MDKFLSNWDLLKMTPGAVVYNNLDLYQFDTIEELFGDYDIVYILYPWEKNTPNIGHWTVLTWDRENDRIVFFDSYGYKLDHHVNDRLYYISKLLLDAYDDYDLQYNSVRLQADNSTVCGYYVVLWAKNYKFYDDVDAFSCNILENAKKAGLTPDQYVFIKGGMLLK